MTIFSWVVGFLLILLIGVPIATINKTLELGVMVAFTCVCKLFERAMFLVSICSLITVFARYVDSESFPPSAYFQVGIIYFLSLSSIGLLAIDLSFTLQDRALDDLAQL